MNNIQIKRGLGEPLIYNKELQPNGLFPFELGYSINKHILYINEKNGDNETIRPISGVVRDFNRTITTADLTDYELGFDKTTHLVYINDTSQNAIIPVGCIPNSFVWTNGTTEGPTGTLSGVGMPDVSIPSIPVASSIQSGVVTTDWQQFGGIKNFFGVNNGIEFQYDNQDTRIKIYKKSNGSLVFALAPQVVDLLLDTSRCKTEYFEGERLDVNNLEVLAKYDNTEVKEVGNYLTIPANGTVLTTSINSVSVTYSEEGTTARKSFPIVVNLILDRIELSGSYKTAYTYGDVLDNTGMVVTAYYTNGTSEVISDYTMITNNGRTLVNHQSTSVIVSYELGGITKTQTYPITVAKAIIGITLGGTPTNEFLKGTAFNTTGLKVYPNYSDGTTGAEVSGYTTTPAAGTILSTVGMTEVVVEYDGWETIYNVTVLQAYTVTITGSGNSTYCYATVNSTKRTSAGTYTVADGASIPLYARARSTRYSSYIIVDGTTVASHTSSTTATSYTYTINSDIDINLTYSTSGNVQVQVTTK